jgi:hypothetical protein
MNKRSRLMRHRGLRYHIPDDVGRDGPRNVGFFYSSDAADCTRRFYWTYTGCFTISQPHIWRWVIWEVISSKINLSRSGPFPNVPQLWWLQRGHMEKLMLHHMRHNCPKCKPLSSMCNIPRPEQQLTVPRTISGCDHS